jgi:glutamate N-acetyltransferase/amino-acid N-acetyltransferase
MEPFPNGTITAPDGFSAAAAVAGLKESGNPDLALVHSRLDCTAVGVFTQNQVVAAPIIVARELLQTGGAHIRGVVVNAGNANACTGKLGVANVLEMQHTAAQALGCQPHQILVLSTGVIGVQLPIEKIKHGIEQAAGRLSVTGGLEAARAIMTTDTRPKGMAVKVDLPGGTVTIGGMAKGSGMIHPHMATMLCVLTTDAGVAADRLAQLLRAAVDVSFNRISVDGDTSTNDALLLLANGASGVTVAGAESLAIFGRALTHVCTELAKMIVLDGEGATKFVEIRLTGCRDDTEAHAIAQTIATSPLVKSRGEI